MPVNSKQWLAEVYPNVAELQLAELQLDSRKVRAGDVFVALPGTQTDGHRYIEQALMQGAALVLCSEPGLVHERVLLLPELQQQLPQLAARFYQQPAQQMQLLGVTGTNGKSSTTFFINQLAEQLALPSAVIGTLGYGRWLSLTELANTTPHYIDIQRILSEQLQQQVQLVAMEVSSHALVQHRLAGLHFQVAIFTNLSRDHLDYHGSMQEYARAKSLLFKPELCSTAVLNVSDAQGRALAATQDVPVWVYGKAADCHGFNRYLAYQQLNATTQGFDCLLTSHAGEHQLQLPLLGEFNVQNALAAISGLLALGYDLSSLLQAASKLQPVPGRMEQFHFASGSTVVVDYAHTPDALEQALAALRLHCRGRLWCVFGCGGDRDRGKRPLMGKIAQQGADHVIITSDNPRSEDPLRICQDIADGMHSDAAYQLEPDRKLAIKLAIASAQPGDVILLAGKGHEKVQIFAGVHHPYDERAFVRQLMSELLA